MLAIAAEMYRQKREVGVDQWSSIRWEIEISRMVELIKVESSARRLGDIFWLDVDLDLPPEVVRSVYLRLFEMGGNDVQTKLCYASYLLRHSPRWDLEAESILGTVEGLARDAGFWQSPVHGHHPVLFRSHVGGNDDNS